VKRGDLPLVSPVVFWLIAGVTVVSALAVVSLRNIVHCALWLVVSFIGVAAVYLLLEAEFLAAVQVLVYAGAISIIIVFGVMLTRRGDIRESNLFSKYRHSGGIVALGFFLVAGYLISQTQWRDDLVSVQGDTISLIAGSLLRDYMIPLEAAALLLLVAMIGSIILAKGVKD
jgi:NADH-quinone oxidoreductase subunit J